MIVRTAAMLTLLVVGAAAAQSTGAPPVPSLAFRDIQKDFALPPLKDERGSPIASGTGTLQVVVRARKLGLTARSAYDAWRGAGDLYQKARIRVDAAQTVQAPEVFTGAKVSQLNATLRASHGLIVEVTSDRLVVDLPLRLDRAGFNLDLGHARLDHTGLGGPYLVRIENTHDVTLRGGVFSGRESGVLVSASRGVTILAGQFIGLAGNGVVVTGGRDVIVWGNHLTALGRAPILLHGSISDSVVADNEITGNVGASNWHAGVVLTDRSVDLVSQPLNLFHADQYGVMDEPIPLRTAIPRRNLVVANLFSQNRASGIYVDGAAQTVIAGNMVEGNAKEGLCLDNGATANVVTLNTVQQNGKRWGSSDDELRRDFVLAFGRMPDGSAKAKTPGISIDNGLYNIVFLNNVEDNFGGGVKMVRTDYFNIVGMNAIVDNNQGRSDKFHFFGIEMGAAPSDAPVPDLDFTPSRGNIVFSNVIRGSHYAGVFFSGGSDHNDVFDNAIFGATDWAMESVLPQSNATLNNLTNQPSRNIDPGMDARLARLSAGRFDGPPVPSESK